MKHLTVVVAALAGISSARSVLTARQEDNQVTSQKICEPLETAKQLVPPKFDESCRSDAQKCIDNQLKKSQVLDQVAQDDITLCTFGPRSGNPSTDFLTICDDLDVARETCHSNTSWCVMDDATRNWRRPDKDAALDRVRQCVARRILNEDGDTLRNFVTSIPDEYNMICKKLDTSVKCNSTLASESLGYAICTQDYSVDDASEVWDAEKSLATDKLARDCGKEFDRTTPASDILKLKQLGQYCQGQGVECSNCKKYALNDNRDQFGPILDVIECQAGAQPGTQTATQTGSQDNHATSATPPADKKPGQPQQTKEEADRQVEEHCHRPGVNTKDCMAAARQCTSQVKVDATMQEFLACVDRQTEDPW